MWEEREERRLGKAQRLFVTDRCVGDIRLSVAVGDYRLDEPVEVQLASWFRLRC